jgi:D-aminoacyl-tRNA deacylase
MRVVIQRVKAAAVKVDNQIIGSINQGLVLLVGISASDSNDIVVKMANKVAKLRVFEDLNGKTNLGLQEINGTLLSVSQFTLYGDVAKGNRPSFTQAASAVKANELYQLFNQTLMDLGFEVATGQFQAMMEVELVNDGPFTLIIDSEDL